jgi:hypothetical protein
MSRPLTTSHVEKARMAWGEELPAWVLAMAEECDGSSQALVAERIGYSAGTVSQVIGRKYLGKPTGVEEAFRSAFAGHSIACPALGDISAMTCRSWREKARTFGNTNSQRVTMYRACRRCPRFAQPKEAEE